MRQLDYSIETACEQIVSRRSRDLFREPLECYLNGVYRLAVVGLWTVVVFDLLEKVLEMSELYKDPTYQKLLTDVASERQKCEQKKSPAWELWLLDQVHTRTQLLDESDYVNLKHIYDLRNLCAHPILREHTQELQIIRHETARACMVHALEGLFCKPALLTGKVVKRLLEDLGEREWAGISQDEFDQFFAVRYFDRLSTAALQSTFRSLWKLTFRDESAEPERHRSHLGRLLLLVYKMDPAGFQGLIASETDQFSSCRFAGSQGIQMHYFLAESSGVYQLLTNSAKQDLGVFLKSSTVDIYATAHYLYPDMYAYIQAIAHLIKSRKLIAPVVAKLPDLHRPSRAFSLLSDEVTKAWKESSSYYESSDLSHIVEYVVRRAGPIELEALMKASNDNNQVYECALVAGTCMEIVKAANEKSADLVDAQRFPNLAHEINKVRGKPGS